MNLFHVNACSEEADGQIANTWLVVAKNQSEAVSQVPQGQVIVSVEVSSPCKPGPARLIGWMGPPPPLPTAVKR